MYCLLVFGQEARTSVWLVRDGEFMHVHASPDGRSARIWRRVRGSYLRWDLGDVYEEGGQVRHTDLCVTHPPSHNPEVSVMVAGLGRQMASVDRSGELEFAASAKDAPVIHFNGPLTVDLYHRQRPLVSNRKVQLTAIVGTRGEGRGTFALFCCDALADAWPAAQIEFPAKKPGDPPVVLRVSLEDD
jgi:hypothetical protein